MAKAQTERTAQAPLQTNLDDLGKVLEQGSQQPWQLIQYSPTTETVGRPLC